MAGSRGGEKGSVDATVGDRAAASLRTMSGANMNGDFARRSMRCWNCVMSAQEGGCLGTAREPTAH
eukprot:11186795-Lingulodinium_polyedra.AAC.1